MKRLLFAALLAGCTHGQFHLENDYGAFFNKNHDQLYTHGTKFSRYEDSLGTRESYSFGQNIYTPTRKRADVPASELEKGRPYTGWLYGEYRRQSRGVSTTDVTGLQLGCTGRCSFAKETQVGVHKLLGQGYPTWNPAYSLRSEPGFVFEKERYFDLHRSDNFSSNYFGLLKLGNIVDSFSAGSSFRFGRGFSDLEPEPVIFRIPLALPRWSYYLFGDLQGRLVAYNHFLQGSLFQSERHRVSADHLVGEANLGARVGYKNFKFSYTYTVISEEWEHQNGAFFFGGIDFSW